MLRKAVSDSECSHIREGMNIGTRRDGRTHLQCRAPVLLQGVVPHTDGSCSVDIGGTQVLVSVAASVAETASGIGELRVHVNCSPAVTSHYAQALGGQDGRYRRIFPSYLSNTISRIFGAEAMTVEDHGVAEVVAGEDDNEVDIELPTRSSDFPGAALVLGSGYAFVVDADVQIFQCNGGNVIGATTLCLAGALRSLRLPHATLHETPTGVSVEVDKTRSWEGKPVDWSGLPTVAVMHWIPGYYILDPSLEEELALPHRAVVASTHSGRVSHWVLDSVPSRQGDRSLGLSPADLRVLITEGVAHCDQLREVLQ